MSNHMLLNLLEGRKVYVRVVRDGETDPRPKTCRLRLVPSGTGLMDVLVEGRGGRWHRSLFDLAKADEELGPYAADCAGYGAEDMGRLRFRMVGVD